MKRRRECDSIGKLTRVWERINLDEIERYIPEQHARETPYGWNHMGLIQIYELLARYLHMNLIEDIMIML